ncbi:hypothetical protein DPMN_014036 [Dreissena polymorpha]|uniref:Uncharacterized protein n=1 Tax=Dreissena polymorpha TaxID=45954 RepID=A0A9D4NA36_DREPO|nr:hypothetical protein DPMN_014036 [Dreissena polymorpha]
MEQTHESQTSDAEWFGLISEPQALSTPENPYKKIQDKIDAKFTGLQDFTIDIL